jgi:hypothetical protein
MVDMATLWRTNGTQVVLLITEDLVYTVSRLSGLASLPWLYTTGTVVASGTNVTGTGMDWTTDGITSGDFIAINTAAGTTSISEITGVTGSGAITIDATLGTYSSTNYQVRRSLKSQRPYLADWTVHLNRLIIASYFTPLLVYDPEVDSDYLAEYCETGDLPATGKFYANCVASFADRVWAGGLDDGSDGERQQRIRWSSITNPDDFSLSTAYIDLPYSSGEIKRLLPMGRILVVYLDDAIYFGTTTNFPNLPVQFSRVETAKTGLIGPRAVTPWKNGHFFVGQDDIYYAHSGGIEPIGTPVLKETIHQCSEPWRIYAVADPKNTRICFGFPTDANYIEKIWSYDYRTQGWSYDELESDMIASPQITESVTWNDLSSLTWDTLSTSYPEWDSFTDEPAEVNMFIEHSNALYQFTETRDSDSWGSDTVIPTAIETGDMNFGAPDTYKTATRLSLRLHSNEDYTSKITWKVEGSTDGGDTFKNLGNLVIYAGKEEGFVNFRLHGSTLRFKLTSSDQVKPYWVDSMVVRVRTSGREGGLGAQDALS